MSARKPAPDMGPTIERLRQIAAEARGESDLSLGDVPSQDAKLLEACADVAHQRSELDATVDRLWFNLDWSDTKREAKLAEIRGKKRRLSALLARLPKLQAHTPAGVYAKALAVRRSRGSAPALALSLADDLLANPALRRAIWPAEPHA